MTFAVCGGIQHKRHRRIVRASACWRLHVPGAQCYDHAMKRKTTHATANRRHPRMLDLHALLSVSGSQNDAIGTRSPEPIEPVEPPEDDSWGDITL